VVEHVGDADEDDVIVIDEGDGDGVGALSSHDRTVTTPRGVGACPFGCFTRESGLALLLPEEDR
jgi:hypothetical protein